MSIISPIYLFGEILPRESDDTCMREFAPLLAVSDQYPKYVVTLDDFAGGNVDEVKHVHPADILFPTEKFPEKFH